MGMNDVIIVGKARPVEEPKPDLPPLYEVIRTLRDKCYAPVRYAYLKEWKYYVIETKEFKLSVKRKSDLDLFEFLEYAGLKRKSFWICIDGLKFYTVISSEEWVWGSSETEKSIQYWIEGEPEDAPLPKRENVVDDTGF